MDGAGLRVRFDVGAIEALRENENDRGSRRTSYVQAGIMTVDEARAELGLGPGMGEGWGFLGFSAALRTHNSQV